MPASPPRASGPPSSPPLRCSPASPSAPTPRPISIGSSSGNGRKLYQEMYDHAELKVHVMPCAFGGAEAGGWFAKEIKTSDDLKGLRMRIFGLGGRVMARLGATTVLVPGGDIACRLRQEADRCRRTLSPAVDARSGLKDKVKLIYVPGWHQPETVLELIVNKDRWDALTDRERGLIDGACLRHAPGDAGQQRQASGRRACRFLPRPASASRTFRQACSRPCIKPGPTSPRTKATRTISSGPFSTTSRNSPPSRKLPRRRPRRTSRLSRVPRPRRKPRRSAI